MKRVSPIPPHAEDTHTHTQSSSHAEGVKEKCRSLSSKPGCPAALVQQQAQRAVVYWPVLMAAHTSAHTLTHVKHGKILKMSSFQTEDLPLSTSPARSKPKRFHQHVSNKTEISALTYAGVV